MNPSIVAIRYALDDAQRAAVESALGASHRVHFVDRPEDLDERLLPDVVALIGGFPATLPPRCPRLRWVQTHFAGVESHVEALRGRDVVLTNTSGAYGLGIAEHLMMTLLMLLRHMPQYGRQQAMREWRQLGPVRSVAGLRVVIVGLGDIGTTFARRVAAFGAHVRGVRRTASADVPECVEAVYPASALDEALQGADVVALCLPHTPETRGLLTKARIDALPQDAIVLNVGRGSAIDQDALARALLERRIFAALDVTTPEPLPADHPLWDCDRLILTPHVSGGNSLPAIGAYIGDLIVRNARRFAQGDALENVVDIEAGY